nr:hypothetical protein [Tanacetum cinerariifolium]
MGDEHLNTTAATESNEFIKSCVENLVPNPIIIPSKIDSLFDEFADELTLLKSIPPGIDETDCHPEKEIRPTKILLYDNSSPRPPEEIVSDNSNADIEFFSPSSILNLDSDSHIEEIDLSFNLDDPMPPSIKEDDYDSGRDIPILEKLLDNYSLSLPTNESYYFDIPSPYRPPAKPPYGFDQTQPPQFPVIHPPPQETSNETLHDQEKELAEYINTPGWNRPTFYNNGDDDDVDYTITITPVLSNEKSDNSLSMGDEHLDTIPVTESDEVIKSSVEDLVPIPSESEGIPDTMCDVHLVNNPTPLEAKDHFEIVINSNDDYSSSDEDSLYENIEYVEASPHDSELVSLEVEKIVILEDEEIEDDNLREKLLKVNLLIAKIKVLRDNPTPSSEFLTKSASTSPKSILEETNTFDNSLPEFENFCFYLEEISSGSTTTHSDISLPEYEAFSFYDDHIKEISSGSTTTQFDISLPEYDSFIFDLSNDQFPSTDRSDFTHEEFRNEPAHIISPPEYDCFYFRNLLDPGEWISSLNPGIRENLSSTTCVNLPVEDDHSPLLAYVVWIFLSYLTCPVIPPHLYSFRNEDTIFDPGITINRFYSSKPSLSHRCGTFKKFNTHRSHLNESPMEMLFSTLFPMNQ